MEIRIQANSIEELKQQVINLASEFGGSTTRISLKMPPPSPVKAPKEELPKQMEPIDIDAPAAEPPPVLAQAGKKGSPKKVMDVVVVDESINETESGDPITRDAVTDMLRVVIAKIGGNGARTLMGKMGYQHIGKIPESEFGKFMNAAKAAIAAKK